MSEITTVGIDLAKNVLSVHGVDAHGKAVLRKSLSRSKLIELMAQLPPCRIGLEACSGAHELARTLQALGHEARIMASGPYMGHGWARDEKRPSQRRPFHLQLFESVGCGDRI